MKKLNARKTWSIVLVLVAMVASFIYLASNGTVILVVTGSQDVEAMQADTGQGSTRLWHLGNKLAVGAYFSRVDRSIQVRGRVGGVDRRADFGYATPGMFQIARVHFKANGSFQGRSTMLP